MAARPRLRWIKRLTIAIVILAMLVAALFVANGLWPSWKTPLMGKTGHTVTKQVPKRLTIMAFNIAKCFAHKGGFSFSSQKEVTKCLDRLAKVIRAQRPDIVFLSEINLECAPCPVNQVRYLAEKCRMHAWAFGENYSFGLPFYRISSGNAVLSRFALEPLTVLQLEHGGPFYSPMGNRRALFVTVDIDQQPLLLGSLRNDSFDLGRNADQVRQLLAFIGKRPALLGGDFNAPPQSKAMQLWKKSERFAARWHGPKTFPADKPDRCIDYVLAPKAWRLVEHRVIDDQTSDHRPVVSIFER
jgi:endonuclease/exonuclease/phosphatase family metal-dependent hydrolase